MSSSNFAKQGRKQTPDVSKMRTKSKMKNNYHISVVVENTFELLKKKTKHATSACKVLQPTASAKKRHAQLQGASRLNNLVTPNKAVKFHEGGDEEVTDIRVSKTGMDGRKRGGMATPVVEAETSVQKMILNNLVDNAFGLFE